METTKKGYIVIMEKKTETTKRGHIVIMEKKTETAIVFRVYRV